MSRNLGSLQCLTMEICTVGGFEEVGKNMTAVKISDDVFIFDAGVSIPALIDLQNDNIKVYSEKHLRRVGAIPNDLVLDKLGWRNKVRAIVIGHSHLDHVGAVPWLAHRYPKAVIIGAPFTMTLLNTILKDERKNIKNKKITVQEGGSIKVRGQRRTYKIDFIHVTHSTLQCANIALHTKEGVFFYAVDFKFDDTPVLGAPPNYQKIKEIGKKGVKALIINSLYSEEEGRSLSESVARKKVKEALNPIRDRYSALFISTFSSHIERLKSIVDFGKATNRKIIFLGRSLNKYVGAAIKVKQCPFQKKITLFKYRNQVDSFLKKAEKDRGKYLIVCTGHQAEENSILDRVVKDKTPFRFRRGDHMIFASSIIPVPQNILAREQMDHRLKKMGVKIKKDVHVSGHGCKEDIRMMIKMLKPEQIIPTHGTPEQELPAVRIAQSLGYKYGKNIHLFKDGKVLKL